VVAEELYFCTVSQRSPDPGDAQGKIDNTYTDEFRVVAEGLGPVDATAGAFIEKNHARFVGRIEGTFFGTAMPTFDNHDDLSAYSAFLDMNYHVSDALKVTAGVRYTDEQKYHSIFNDADAIAILAPTGPAGTGSPFGSQNVSFTNFSPRAVIAYDAGSVNYYASFNRGFKSGGFNSPGFTLDPVLKPETITAYEVGAKYRSADGTLRASGALFDYDWKNQQVSFITGGGTGIQQQNAASARIYGAELDLDYAPLEAFLLSGGLGYTHARYTDFNNAAVYDLIGGVLTATAANLNGQRLPQAPDYTANANATYRFHLPENWGASLVLGARYTSQADFTPDGGGELGAARQKAYTLVNASAIFAGPNEHLQLRVFITNLTGVKYISLISTGSTGVYETPAEPRLVGVSAQYSF
jgi:iron complex outermembrane receptor protein